MMGGRAVWVGALVAALVGSSAWALLETLQERREATLAEIAEAARANAALRGSVGTMPEDNSLCLLCHANFREEELVTTHLEQGITCATCHGLSFEHMDDETSVTKPDVLHGRAEVRGFCLRCHEDHAQPEVVEEFLAQWKGKVRPNGRLILPQAMCTDCHGVHVLRPVFVPEAEAQG